MLKKIILLSILIFIPVYSVGDNINTVLSGSLKFEKIINNAPELIRYTALGDTYNVKKLLKNGANPNQKFMKITPSFVAIYKNYPEILEILFNFGADPNESYIGETLLGFAIYRDNIECVKVLINKGADINLKSLNNLPINISLKNKNTEISKILYNSGSTLDKKSLKLIKKYKYSF